MGPSKAMVALTTLSLCALLAACSGSQNNTSTTSMGATGTPGGSPTSRVDSQALLHAAGDDADWIVPGKTYAGNRLTGLAAITKANVSHLHKAWITSLADDGEQEASPLISQGTMYVSTPHDNVVALDAKTGTLKWAFPYSPSYELQYAVNRGVGLADGKVFIVTADCRLIALDAATGKQVYDVAACRDTSNSWYSTAVYVYKDTVVVGTSGGDLGSMGTVNGFAAADGSKKWTFNTVPQPGEANHNSWPGDSWKHGGAAVWAGLSIDQNTDTLYVAPGNAGPNLTLAGRKGKDLYSDSIVALDISGAQPKLKWYYQVLQNDTHDADPSMPPVLFDATVNGRTRHLLASGDKAGDFVVLDRTTGKPVYRMAVSNQQGIMTTVPTLKGTYACPNHGGGIEWNGGSYDPSANVFIIPSTQECAVWKVTTTGPVAYVAGQPYSAGPLPKRRVATGFVTAVDMKTGKIKWRNAIPFSGQGGVLITKNGLAFTSDVRGRLYAFDTATGKELWHDDAGSSIVAPISAYSVGGTEYLAVVAGEGGNQKTPNVPKTQGSRVVAYALDASHVTMNDSAGQPAVAMASNAPAKTESGTGAGSTAASGSVPYTMAQVQTGKSLYAQQCSSCHGAQLQGVSAPALRGSSFAHANLNVSQIRTIVTQQMPLSAPGSLKPNQYAAIMAYILASDCVTPSGGGKTPFPTTDVPAFKKVVVNSGSCPVK